MNLKSYTFFLFITLLISYSIFPIDHLLDNSFRTVTTRIQSLNLINGLNLTKTQIRGLIKLNENLRAYVNKIRPKFHQITKEYLDYEKILSLKGFEIDKSIFKKINELHHEEVILKANLTTYFKKLTKKLDELMSTAQLQVAANFNPCIVPPDDFTNPVRSGQAGSDDKFVKLLETFRKLPDFLLIMVFENFWKKMIPHVKLFIKDANKREKHKEKVLQIITKAREMNEKEFQLSKKELAKDIMPYYPKIYTMFKSYGHWGARFLLNPIMLNSYRQMLKSTQ